MVSDMEFSRDSTFKERHKSALSQADTGHKTSCFKCCPNNNRHIQVNIIYVVNISLSFFSQFYLRYLHYSRRFYYIADVKCLYVLLVIKKCNANSFSSFYIKYKCVD